MCTCLCHLIHYKDFSVVLSVHTSNVANGLCTCPQTREKTDPRHNHRPTKNGGVRSEDTIPGRNVEDPTRSEET